MERAQSAARAWIHVFGRLPERSSLRRGESFGMFLFGADVPRNSEGGAIFGSSGICEFGTGVADRTWTGEHDQRATGFRKLFPHDGSAGGGGTRFRRQRRFGDSGAGCGAELRLLAERFRRVGGRDRPDDRIERNTVHDYW